MFAVAEGGNEMCLCVSVLMKRSAFSERCGWVVVTDGHGCRRGRSGCGRSGYRS
jgi:hypothetical protein